MLWGHELRRCVKNPHSVDDIYDAKTHHKWNRKKLRKIKPGSIIEYKPTIEYNPPSDAAPVDNTHKNDWVKAKVLRVVRNSNIRSRSITVPINRCIHQHSVRCTERMLRNTRKNMKLWGAGLNQPAATLKERHIVTPATFEHLRDFIFNTDFLELLKATYVPMWSSLCMCWWCMCVGLGLGFIW